MKKFIKENIPVAVAALFIVLAAFFRFALIGYSFLALCCVGVAALILAFWALKKWNFKKLRIALTILTALGVLLVIALEIPIVMNARTDENPEADYLVILGAGVHGTTPSLSLRNRCDAALEYLNSYPNAIAIPSGGRGEGEDITEALAIFNYLTARGIAPERIIMEDRATSTRENIRFSKEIIDSLGGGSVAIVSSEYHLFRAKLMAREEGISDPKGVAGHTTYPVLRLNYFLREAGGILYEIVF